MPVRISELVPAQYVSDSQATMLTAALTTVIIDKATVTNVSGANVALSINIVAEGDVPSNSNLVLDAVPIIVGDTYTLPEIVGQVLVSGSYLSTLAGAVNALVIRISGREVS